MVRCEAINISGSFYRNKCKVVHICKVYYTDILFEETGGIYRYVYILLPVDD